MAGWALGLAIFPSLITWIIAVVLAIITLRETARTGTDHGKTLAISALVIVGAWLVLAAGIVVLVLATGVERDDETGRVTDGGDALIANLRQGDCLPAPPVTEDDEQLLIELVPCDRPHDAEVYGTWELTGEWTTADEVDQTSQAGCVERFEPYVGKPYRRSELGVLYYLPLDEASFRADPTVVCILTAPEQVSASLEGSRR